MRIALVTSSHVDPAATDDRFLHAALQERGHEADWLAWDDATAKWQDYDCVLLRSCWGYHEQPEKFRAWIERCAGQGLPLVNPAAMVLQNMHKHYLLELAAAGFKVPPLRLLLQGATVDLEAILAALQGEDAVIKPAVSGTAWQTWRVQDIGVAHSQERLRKLLQDRDMLVQRYEPTVTQQGEWSLVFIDRTYSHSVLKVPKPDDYRSQADFGASLHFVDAPPAIRDAATAALRLLGRGAAYARVDIIDSPSGTLLMEVELIEPVLFFAARPGAAFDFVAHLEQRILSRPRKNARA